MNEHRDDPLEHDPTDKRRSHRTRAGRENRGSDRLRRLIATLLGTVIITTSLGAATPVFAATPAPARYRSSGLVVGPATGAIEPLPAEIAAAAAEPLPDAVDLPPWAVPSGDQGAVGSCTAWAVAYTVAGWYANKLGAAGVPFAPMSVYSITSGGRNAGTSYSSTIAVAANNGIDPLAYYPKGNYNYTSTPTPAEYQMASNFRITATTRLFGLGQIVDKTTLIKAALAAGKPVTISTKIYSNFTFLPPSRVLDAAAGTAYSWHAVAVLGYDATGITIQNSWGRNWGNDGFIKLTWNYVRDQVAEAFSIDDVAFTPAQGAPAVASLSTPTASYTGQTVTVTGTDLRGARLTVSDALQSKPTVNADGTVLTATIAASAKLGAALLVIETPSGRTTKTFGYSGPAPVITALNPAAGPEKGGNVITITGSGLQVWPDGGTRVTFAGRPATKLVGTADGSSLQVTVPAGTPGTVPVSVTTSQGTTNQLGSYEYRWTPAPKLTLTAPKLVAPGTVTVKGRVTQRGRAVAGVTATLLSHDVGSSAAWVEAGTFTTDSGGNFSASMSVTASQEYRFSVTGGSISPVASVTVKPVARVSAISAGSGPRTGMNTLTITGTDLSGHSVYFGTVAARVVSVDATSITVVVPRSSKVGPVVVNARSQVGVSNSITYTYA